MGLVLAATIATGCSDDPASPVGDLARPSGLVYVERADDRGDLFIADSEVDGVRLQQFLLLPTGTSTRIVDAFALAPAVFSSLIIPAPGFPTELAFAEMTESRADGRLYVLAAAGVSVDPNSGEERVGLIHIVDASDGASERFPTRGSGPTLGSLGQIALGPMFSGPMLPVGLEILSSSESVDQLLLVLDAVDDQDGVVALLELDFSGGAPNVTMTDSVAVPAGARKAAYVPSSDTSTVPSALVVPSSRSRFVTTLVLSEDDPPRFASVQPVEVGGPTRLAVAAGDRVVVNRTDRPSLVVLVRNGDGFVRDSRFYESPFTTEDEVSAQDPDLFGRIDLISPIADAVYVENYPRALRDPDLSTSLQQVTDPETGEVVLGDDGQPTRMTVEDFIGEPGDPVLFVAHTNGLGSFVVGDPFVVTISSTSGVARSTPMTDFSEVEQCPLTTPRTSESFLCNLDVTVTLDLCQGQVVQRRLPEVVRYRAEFLGSLFESRSGDATLVSRDGTSAVFDITEPTGTDFASQLIEPGDRVFVQTSIRDGCQNTGLPAEVRGSTRETGVVEEILGSVLRVRFTDPEGLFATRCPSGESLDLGVFEVRPGDQSAVIRRMRNETLVETLERVPYGRATNDDGVELFVAEFSSPLQITVTSSRTATSSTSSIPCELTEASRYCLTAADCGDGRTCEPGDTPGCRGTCSECMNDAGCLSDEAFQRCDGVEIEVTATQGAQINLRDSGAPTTETVSAVLSHAVFHPLLEGFVVSAPGSRTLIVVVPVTGGYVVDVTR